LRKRSPDLKRGFRVPFSPVVPILSALSAVALIFNGLPLQTIVAYFVWLFIGLGVYFTYSRRHSKLQG
jgi:APA family basic amino acid/polyamine antiporter